jgi:ATP-dependent RNA helicase DHX57
MDFDSERQTSALLMKMASQNSMRQRKGRAGRVQKGRCFRIINETAFEKLPVNTVPEMLRSPLDNLILQVKAMNLKENCVQLLSRCPDPPMLSAIEAAIENLIKIQALDKSETLTPLGRHISYLPCDPSIGKLLIYGSLLGSLFHASSIAACITNRSPFQNFSSNEMKPFEEFSKKQFDGNIISDYTVMSATMLTYNETKNKRGFCKSYGLSFDRLREISESQHDLLEGLVSVGFIDAVSDGLRADSPYNQNIRIARIVTAVMSAGLYPKVCKILRPPKRFVETLGGNLEKSVEAIELKFYLPEKNDSFDNKTSTNTLMNEKFKQKNIDIATEEMTRVFVHPTSICFSNSSYNSSNFVIFGDKQLSINTQKESKVYLRNVSEVGPYALLLFGGKLEAQYLEGTITIDNWIRFSAPGKIVAMIQLLRKKLDELLEEKINNTDINIINSKVLDAACKLLATDGLHT